MRLWRKRQLMILTVCFLWLWSVALIYWYVVNREKDDIRDGVPLLLWWTNDVTWPYNELRRCGARTCHVTNNHKKLKEARGILFYGSNLKTFDYPLPRQRNHQWGLLHEESPRNVPFVPYTEFLQHFNYTSTFSRHSNLPLTTQYLPYASDLSSMDFFRSFEDKQVLQFNDQIGSVVFLQTDCNTMSGREDYVQELMQYIQVDSYGGCLHNRDLPASLQNDYLNNLYSDELMRFLSPYKFMIAIENGVCEDYITEKYWRPLIAGIIPIYFGSPSIRDWEPHLNSAVYVSDFANASALAAHLHFLAENATAYDTYRSHKLNRANPIANSMLLQHLLTRRYHAEPQKAELSLFHKFECLMCEYASSTLQSQSANEKHYSCPLPPAYAPLQQQKKPKYASDWRSMMNVGRCQAQLLDKFIRANRSFTSADFQKELKRMVQQELCD
ncbi:PREDICTED: alpha-(1,3)-fucosyltransferase B [Drosophila arizonae]|uniref:Fucosyltransferase n=1 Tax=Drosophila arizonae TaxID=7263 RepID=A0ABM1NVQ8_DROAR|nr:PREDICTED: alpha-(1,3)-fucosyltransferase B [Drosophila arizonae]